MMLRKRTLFILFPSLLLSLGVSAASQRVHSPDGRLVMEIDVEGTVTFAVRLEGTVAVAPSVIDLAFAGKSVLGTRPEVTDIEETAGDVWIEPVVARRRARIHDRYNGLRIAFETGSALEFRAYNDGVAYRFVTREPGEVEVTHERMDFRFPDGTMTWFPEEESIISHNERLYPYLELAEIDAGRFCSLPVLLDPPGGVKVLFSEADLYDYPSLFMKGGEGAVLSSKHPLFVLEAMPDPERPDRNQVIGKEADYIARTDGTRNFPWRVFIIGDNDGTFLESELIFTLSRPPALEDTAWIRPGRVAWDWYNANNFFGVDFKSGINTESYKYFIDFAAEYGLEYVILDEGWSRSTTAIDEPNPDIDLPGLIAYGRERGVGIILWALWGPVARDRETLFPLYHQWGVKGVKIDFMQRSDQEMVNFYHETVKLAAENQLLVDFHGAFKPGGLRRAYPNYITCEGVRGNEWNKWSHDNTPTHTVTLPFTRMVVGPMDYTPGAMTNLHVEEHYYAHARPAGMGTRAHEVAKYVLYESPLQMLCDSPSVYRREAATTRFISRIPTTWDETQALDAKVAEYLLVARRKGNAWYVGAMTNEEPRSLVVDWSFLPEGEFLVEIFADGINADRHAEDYKMKEIRVSSGDRTGISLAPGGGWTAIVSPKGE